MLNLMLDLNTKKNISVTSTKKLVYEDMIAIWLETDTIQCIVVLALHGDCGK
jgi:hypothetical protein